MRRFIASALVIAAVAIAACGPSGGKPGAASCPGSRSVPQSYTEPGALSTTLHFVQTGCAVGIASIELHAGNHLVRNVVFNPALPAGALSAEMAAAWSGSGSFRGTAQVASSLGTVAMTQQGTYKATATAVLTQPLGGPSRQWATGATASSQLSDNWAASKAIGGPTRKAWAPSSEDGATEWLELTYAQAVIPTGIDIWEFNGPGFVTKIEGFDQKKNGWAKLWEGTDPTNHAPKAFSPPLAKTTLSTNRIRLTVNTAVPDWNEIGAVALVGATQPAGQIIWLQGSWAETGKQTSCLDKKCATTPMNAPNRDWRFAFNTLTGKVGTIPEQVT
jgi:hypothetical protein